MASPNVLVIGSANIDYIMQLPHLPAVGETVTDGRFLQVFGGKGANQAVAAARAGGAVTFLTAVGDEPAADQMKESFAGDGIDISHIHTAAGQTTGAALIMFGPEGENYLAVAPGANDAIQAADIDQAGALFDAADVLIMQMELPPAAMTAALAAAAARSLPVVFNYAPVRGKAVAVTGAMTTLVVNENEASELAGLPVETAEQAQAAADALRAMGPGVVVVTLGKQGALGVSEQGAVRVLAHEVKPVDTTAAGDTFCGALAVAMGEGQPLEQAMQFASAASAVCVTGLGAQPSIPTREAIEQMLAD